MSKEQHSKKYLDIPGEKILVHNFRFDMSLPPPIPHPKTMYIPFDSERYIKPKLTLLHVKKKPVIMTDINLSVPAEEVNMRPELYNPPPNAKYVLSSEIKELIEEKIQKEPKKKAAVKGSKSQTNGKSSINPSVESTNKVEGLRKESKPEPIEIERAKSEKQKPTLAEYIKKSFETVKSFTKGANHPTKEGLVCTEAYEIVPDLQNLFKEFYVLKTEAFTDTLKTKDNIMKFDQDIDKKPILSVYLQKPLIEQKDGEKHPEDQEENNEEYQPYAKFADDPLFQKLANYEHTGNYIYSVPKIENNIKREIVLNINKIEEKAYIYQPQSVVFKKKKVLFMNKTFYKEEDIEEEKKDFGKKTIKLLKRDQLKDELVLRKRKFEEMRLAEHPLATQNEKLLNDFVEEPDDLEIIQKKIIEEEQEIENSKAKRAEDEQEEEEEEDKEEADDPATKELADFFMEEDEEEDDDDHDD